MIVVVVDGGSRGPQSNRMAAAAIMGHKNFHSSSSYYYYYSLDGKSGHFECVLSKVSINCPTPIPQMERLLRLVHHKTEKKRKRRKNGSFNT